MKCTGRCLGPEMKFEASHSAGPAGRCRAVAQQLAQQRLDLDAGDVRAEAEVRSAAPEGDLVVRRASDVEAVGLSEGALVAVCGAVVHDDLVAGCDGTPASSQSCVAVRRM